MAQHTTSTSSRPSSARTKALSPVIANRASVPAPVEGVSERERMVAALRMSERKHQALLSTVSELIFIVSKDGLVAEFYAPKENDYMLSAEGLVGKRVMELLPAQIGQQAMYYVEKTLRTGQVQIYCCQFQMPTGPRHFEARLAVYDVGQVVALVRDVTDRNYLEREVLEISNREQMRIGQDLHDGLGQHLTGITFLAKALERKLAARSLPEAVEAAQINQLVIQALSQTRSLARGLFPVELESRGLLPAFRDLAERVEKMFGIACLLECDDGILIHYRTAATHLFRLAQEAISNSVKHGKAKQVVISLKKDKDKTVLMVRDDGVGFSSGGAPTRGLGLRIMSYRAQKVGGTLEIHPGEGGGTIVTCSFSQTFKEI